MAGVTISDYVAAADEGSKRTVPQAPDLSRNASSVGLPLTMLVVATALAAGYALAAWSAPVLHDRKLPWIASRGLGVAAYLTLVVGVLLGLWLRHPWRHRLRLLSPSVCLRLHVTVIAASAVTTAAHVTAVAVDTYAHIGWSGGLLPGRSGYRPFAVGLGTLGLYGMLLVGGTALLAGRLFGTSWLPVHRTATVWLALIWAHGVLTGSDVRVLRPIYIASGLAVLLLALSHRVATDPIAEAFDRGAISR